MVIIKAMGVGDILERKKFLREKSKMNEFGGRFLHLMKGGEIEGERGVIEDTGEREGGVTR